MTWPLVEENIGMRQLTGIAKAVFCDFHLIVISAIFVCPGFYETLLQMFVMQQCGQNKVYSIFCQKINYLPSVWCCRNMIWMSIPIIDRNNQLKHGPEEILFPYSNDTKYIDTYIDSYIDTNILAQNNTSRPIRLLYLTLLARLACNEMPSCTDYYKYFLV